MPYRTDLKRPDLKGQFPCSVCQKVFCHSSSLSRHRMQAHYKSYICTQCNQEIHSSETLRSHMYRCHQIQRMFMCRCCNWAFPDKTSLHIHMQSMQKSGKPGDVSVLARSSLDKSETEAAAAASGDTDHANSFGSPDNSSPDEEQHYRGDSLSPCISDMDEHQQGGFKMPKLEEGIHPPHPTMVPHHMAGIFPNHFEQPADLLLTKLGAMKAEPPQQEERVPPLVAQVPPVTPALLQQQWLAQLLANNPYFGAANEANKLHGQQPGANAKLLQTLCAAITSAASRNQQARQQAQQAQQPPQLLQQLPPQQVKKTRRGEKRKTAEMQQQMDLSLQIPVQQRNNSGNFAAVSPAVSEGSSATGKLNTLISNLLSIREGQNSPAMDGKSCTSDGAPERKNKRKLRTPTRAEMTEIIYGDEPVEDGVEKPVVMPFLERLMDVGKTEVKQEDATEQQPSPAFSDSQTSGTSSGHLDVGPASPKKCAACQANLDGPELQMPESSKKLRENIQQIRHLSDRIATLANTVVVETNAKEELLLCARQLQAIASGH